MSQFIPEETIQEVLYHTDIVDVIGDYVLLKKGGTNYKGLCPFHSEKTPSFTVSPTKGLFYCFGCQASGNVFRFLMQYENLSFPEAVEFLASRCGISIPDRPSRPQQDALHQLYSLHKAATVFFHRQLLRNPAAQQVRAYCRQRRLTNDVATRFDLGYAPATWDALYREMQHQGFPQELLVQSGLVIAREHTRGAYDRFRHRLIFPIHDRQGRPVAFGGRYLEGTQNLHAPKYLNSPETSIFHKSRTLYGFHLARQAIRQEERAIIVEGYTDVIACHRHGVTPVIGTLGTALTEHHVKMLKGLAKEVILVFDSDAAGGSATERSIGLFLDAGVRVRIVELPEGDDPDSFLQQRTAADFLRCVDEAVTFLEYLLLRTKHFYDLQTPSGQADCVARILPLLAKITSQVEQWGYITLLADKIGVPVEVLQREIHARSGANGVRRQTPKPIAAQRHDRQLPPVEYDLLRLVLHDFSILEQVRHQIIPEDFHEPVLRDIYTLLLRFPANGTTSVFPSILDYADSATQHQLLAKMASEPLVGDAEGRCKALHDYLIRIQQRGMQARLHQLKEHIRTAERDSDATEQQRLLQEYTMLSREMRLREQSAKA